MTAGGDCSCDSDWVRERREKLAAGELDDEEVEMVHAIEPYADQTLYGSCIWDAEGPAGWAVVHLDQRRVVYWQLTPGVVRDD